MPQSYAGAARWLRLAADQGFAPAQDKLGRMHQYGRGVARDEAAAFMWYDLAAQGGSASAGEQRELLAQALAPVELERAAELEQDWRARDESAGSR